MARQLVQRVCLIRKQQRIPSGKNQMARQMPQGVNRSVRMPAWQAGQAVAATTTGWISTGAGWTTSGPGWYAPGGVAWYTVVCGGAGGSALYGGGCSTKGEAALTSSTGDFSILETDVALIS